MGQTLSVTKGGPFLPSSSLSCRTPWIRGENLLLGGEQTLVDGTAMVVRRFAELPKQLDLTPQNLTIWNITKSK